MLSNRTYDFLKWLCAFGLHFIGAAYVGLAGVWSLPFAEEISKTLDIIGALVGAFLIWENYDYNQKLGAQVTFDETEENETTEEA